MKKFLLILIVFFGCMEKQSRQLTDGEFNQYGFDGLWSCWDKDLGYCETQFTPRIISYSSSIGIIKNDWRPKFSNDSLFYLDANTDEIKFGGKVIELKSNSFKLIANLGSNAKPDTVLYSKVTDPELLLSQIDSMNFHSFQSQALLRMNHSFYGSDSTLSLDTIKLDLDN